MMSVCSQIFCKFNHQLLKASFTLASNKNPSAEHLAGGLLFRMQRSDTQEAAWVLTSKPWQGDFISHGDWIDGERDASM